jgi:hypothetical protein
MLKLFFCSGRVAGNIAMRSSSSVPIAIGAIAIAARSAGSKRVFTKGEAPIDGTTGSVRIDGASGPHWFA